MHKHLQHCQSLSAMKRGETKTNKMTTLTMEAKKQSLLSGKCKETSHQVFAVSQTGHQICSHCVCQLGLSLDRLIIFNICFTNIWQKSGIANNKSVTYIDKQAI